ncbi:MAG: TonB-dependent receptor [Alphaproteobacteria bacterium]|nr:TonB-dependent receptor [Alphaproteobacteria bacterium]
MFKVSDKARFSHRLMRSTTALVGLSLVPVAVAQNAPVATEVVRVVGYSAQNSEAIEAKRESETIAEYLSSDDIGQQPDYNIADSFRRLPGVQTVFDEDEGRYVSIRGLNPSYTLGTFDGAVMANAERGNRQLNMEAIPSTAVKRIEVLKARTPDLDGNAIGGTVNLVSRSAFDQSGLYVAANAFVGVSDSQDVPGKGYGRKGDDAANLRMDGTVSSTFGDRGQFGVLFSGSWSRKHRDQERLLPQLVPVGITSTPQPATTAFGATDLLWSTYPNSVDRYGGVLKFEYRPTNELEAGASLVYFRQDDNELRHSQRLRNGTAANGSFVRFNDYPIEKPLFVSQLWSDLRPDEDHEFSVRASYSEATFREPSNEVLFTLASPQATFDVGLVGGVPVATRLDPRFNQPASYAFTSYAPYEDDSDEYVLEAAIDYGFNTGPGDRGWGAGFGARMRQITRDNDRTQTIFNGYLPGTLSLEGFTASQAYTPIFAGFSQLFVDFDKFQTFFNQNRAQFRVDTLNTARQSVGSDWVVEEQVNALYAMAHHRTDRHTVILGLRYEETLTDVERFSRRSTVVSGVTTDAFTRVSQDGKDTRILPSLTASYDLTPSWKLRFGYAQAVGRPNFSSLGGAETIASDGSISRGNADLQPRRGETYEASVETYLPGDQGMISLGVFHKDVGDEIVTLQTLEAVNGVQTVVNQPVNADSATIKGLEVAFVRNRLDFLPGLMSNFGVSANATWIDGAVRLRTPTAGRFVDGVLTGQADMLANLAVFYEDGPFRARATYAYVSETPTAANPASASLNPGAANRKDGETRQLDLQARLELGVGRELIAEVRNATDEDKVNYFGPNLDIVRDYNSYGRQFWVGFAFKG